MNHVILFWIEHHKGKPWESELFSDIILRVAQMPMLFLEVL